MKTTGPTSWYLNGDIGWRTGFCKEMSAGIDGLRLAADPHGPLRLGSSDGSLGGLVMPRGFCIDVTGLTYLLEPDGLHIRRYDPTTHRFLRLPALGGFGTGARQFGHIGNLASAGDNLYVVDRGNRRLQVFSRTTLVLRYLWTEAMFDGWDPVDIACNRNSAFVLDNLKGRIYRHDVDSDRLELIFDPNETEKHFTRIALEANGNVLLWNEFAQILEVYGQNGVRIEKIYDAGALRGRIEPPWIRLDHQDRFCLPAGLIEPCAPTKGCRPPPEEPLWACLGNEQGLIFNQDGDPAETPIEPEQPGPARYLKKGVWISEPLDGGGHDCRWHRMELLLDRLSVGSKVVCSTVTANDRLDMKQIGQLPESMWKKCLTELGSDCDQDDISVSGGYQTDALVQSRAGRYLWVRIELESDGYATPVIRATRVHYPRDSIASHLPAVYASNPEDCWFLERFLSIFQSEWDGLEGRIENQAAYFDPTAVPERLLSFLAGWLDVSLPGDWSVEQKRRLLSAMPKIYAQRGTPQTMRMLLRAYLRAITGLTDKQQRDYPILVEGFRKRDVFLVDDASHASLGRMHPLWSPAVTGRLQLGVFSTESRVRLCSTGDPVSDIFGESAHAFDVYVPSIWVESAEQEQWLHNAIQSEKPAHVSYRLNLVESRFRIGLQSTVGIDTIVGGLPGAVLAGESTENLPPSRPPKNLLNYDMVLTDQWKQRGGVPLDLGSRMGMETVLT